MANLSIRNLDEETAERLRALAEEHGISMEEEVRRILRRATCEPKHLGDLAVEIFSPSYDDSSQEEFQLPERQVAEPMTFE